MLETQSTVCVMLHCICLITWNPPPTLASSGLCWVKRAKREICTCDNSNAHLQTKLVGKKTALSFCVYSLWDNYVPPPPRPVHLPLPADVIPGCGHVLHGPPAPTESVRGAGGRFGCLPAAHETAPVGLLDMADHAVTETDHRGRHGACFMFFSRPLFFPIMEGAQAHKHLRHLARLCTLSAVLNHSHGEKEEKCVTPEICSLHICLYICTKVVDRPLLIIKL